MKAVFIPSPRKVEIKDVPEPEPKDDLVVVKIMSSAICGTEHRLFEAGAMPDLVGGGGHEGAGIVWKIDKAKRVKIGDRVTIYPTIFENCFRCVPCWSGEWQRCENPVMKRSRMGTHTQYMLVPEYVCLPIPTDIPFVVGAMIDDCLGTPYRAIKKFGVNPNHTVLITGVGPIGMSALVISKYFNARVIVVDPNTYRLDHALKNGADFVMNPASDDVLTKIKEVVGAKGVDIALDCSGEDSAQIQCIEALGGGGKMAFLGIKSTATTINPWTHLGHKEITVIGSWASTPQEHTELVRMIQNGMPVENIITHKVNIDLADQAFDKFFSGQAVKVIINPWDS